MFFYIDTPEILDYAALREIKDKQQLTSPDLLHLHNVDQLRQEFKSILNKDKLKLLIQSQQSIIQYNDKLEQYLKTNVETMKILLLRQSGFHPKYEYKLFISKNQPKYTTEKNNTIEEACGCEIVMARYLYSIAFNNNVQPIMMRIKYMMLSQCNNLNQSDINQALSILSTGISPLQRLCNVMDDLLQFLVKSQQTLIPELKMTVIFSIRLLLECNLNFLFLELLRPQKEYETIAKVCRTTYSKLNDAYNRLSAQRDLIQQEVFDYCQSAQTYFRLYGIWAILMKNEKDILLERFKQKGYQILTSENCKIANDIMKKNQEISGQKKISELDQFTLQFVNVCFVPTLQKSLNIYTQNQQAACKGPDDLLMSLSESYDYTDCLKQQQQA